ncbi:MAG: hypothetical protein ACXQS4_02570 [Methermicoccaceae archaeon]
MDELEQQVKDVLKVMRLMGTTRKGRLFVLSTSQRDHARQQRMWLASDEVVRDSVMAMLHGEVGLAEWRAEQIASAFAKCREKLGADQMWAIWELDAMDAYALECAVESARWI